MRSRKRQAGFWGTQTFVFAGVNGRVWVGEAQLGLLVAAIAGCVPKSRHSEIDPFVVIRQRVNITDARRFSTTD